MGLQIVKKNRTTLVHQNEKSRFEQNVLTLFFNNIHGRWSMYTNHCTHKPSDVLTKYYTRACSCWRYRSVPSAVPRGLEFEDTHQRNNVFIWVHIVNKICTAEANIRNISTTHEMKQKRFNGTRRATNA